MSAQTRESILNAAALVGATLLVACIVLGYVIMRTIIVW